MGKITWHGLVPDTDPRYDEVQIWLGAPPAPPSTGPLSDSAGDNPPQEPSPSGESPETDAYPPVQERMLSSDDPLWEGVVSMADSFKTEPPDQS